MRIIDLFSGAGGLTFGFYYKKESEGFVRNTKNTFVFANEYDKSAAEAYLANYSDINMIRCDIKELTSQQIKKLIGNEPVDLIIGGPPCQSYSTVGLRNYDDKAELYKEYCRVLDIVKPKMFLFENVRGILSMREVFYKKDEAGEVIYEYTNVKDKESLKPRKRPVVDHYGELIIKKMEKVFANIDGHGFGYNITKEVLNAVDYGIPENRERVFIVGIRNDLKIKWEKPEPLKENKLSIKEAISDLPIVTEGETITTYNARPTNMYQRLMRKGSNSLSQHYCGTYGEKIRIVIQNVKQGEGKDDFNTLIEEGKIDKKYKLTSGYKNTYGRLIENQPSTTITNNFSTPSGLRCIHYIQNRALTPREGARIQSFPDWFEFRGCKTDVTRQIGNAVPPLLAMQLASKFEQVLELENTNE